MRVISKLDPQFFPIIMRKTKYPFYLTLALLICSFNKQLFSLSTDGSWYCSRIVLVVLVVLHILAGLTTVLLLRTIHLTKQDDGMIYSVHQKTGRWKACIENTLLLQQLLIFDVLIVVTII